MMYSTQPPLGNTTGTDMSASDTTSTPVPITTTQSYPKISLIFGFNNGSSLAIVTMLVH